MGLVTSIVLAGSVAVPAASGDHSHLAINGSAPAYLQLFQGNRTVVRASAGRAAKLWSNGQPVVSRLVVDLGGDGFFLLGARIDYLDARPIATLIYRRRAHVINLFIVQGRESEVDERMEPQLQGFNILRWSQCEATFSAISDINPDELRKFGAKYRAAVEKGYPSE